MSLPNPIAELEAAFARMKRAHEEDIARLRLQLAEVLAAADDRVEATNLLAIQHVTAAYQAGWDARGAAEERKRAA